MVQFNRIYILLILLSSCLFSNNQYDFYDNKAFCPKKSNVIKELTISIGEKFDTTLYFPINSYIPKGNKYIKMENKFKKDFNSLLKKLVGRNISIKVIGYSNYERYPLSEKLIEYYNGEMGDKIVLYKNSAESLGTIFKRGLGKSRYNNTQLAALRAHYLLFSIKPILMKYNISESYINKINLNVDIIYIKNTSRARKAKIIITVNK